MGIHSKKPIEGPLVEGLIVNGKTVPSWLHYQDMGEYGIFDRVAMEDDEGRTPLAQMHPKLEFMVYPGVIYRLSTPPNTQTGKGEG